jgi:hypothetical protein
MLWKVVSSNRLQGLIDAKSKPLFCFAETVVTSPYPWLVKTCCLSEAPPYSVIELHDNFGASSTIRFIFGSRKFLNWKSESRPPVDYIAAPRNVRPALSDDRRMLRDKPSAMSAASIRNG